MKEKMICKNNICQNGIFEGLEVGNYKKSEWLFPYGDGTGVKDKQRYTGVILKLPDLVENVNFHEGTAKECRAGLPVNKKIKAENLEDFLIDACSIEITNRIINRYRTDFNDKEENFTRYVNYDITPYILAFPIKFLQSETAIKRFKDTFDVIAHDTILKSPVEYATNIKNLKNICFEALDERIAHIENENIVEQ